LKDIASVSSPTIFTGIHKVDLNKLENYTSSLQFYDKLITSPKLSRPLLGKLIVAELVRKVPVFYGNQRFVTMSMRSHHWTLS